MITKNLREKCANFKRQKIFLNKTQIFAFMIKVYLLFMNIVNLTQASRKQFKVHWNASNPIFRIDNTDNVIDINKGNAPWEHDQVHIVCPFYQSDRQKKPGIDTERYIIYNVNKEEFDSCRIQKLMPR